MGGEGREREEYVEVRILVLEPRLKKGGVRNVGIFLLNSICSRGKKKEEKEKEESRAVWCESEIRKRDGVNLRIQDMWRKGKKKSRCACGCA